MKKLTKNEFIKKASVKHKYVYDYSLVNYINSTTKVKIICPKHGEFNQVANSHIQGFGCSKCAGRGRTTEECISEFRVVHGDKYDYTDTVYNGSKKKMVITCKEHGPFKQSYYLHRSGAGCKKCGHIKNKESNKMGMDEFINLANKTHDNKYDYSLVNYVNSVTKVNIICPEHGKFQQIPHSHLKGHKCVKCSTKERVMKITKTQEQFIKDSILVHGNKYDYSEVNYTKTNNKVNIICPEHGKFRQRAYKHLQNQGCPICRESHMEKVVRGKLICEGIKFKSQYGGKGDDVYLEGQLLDFYLPEKNIGIECQGEQHFIPVDFGNKGHIFSYKQYQKNIIRDDNKLNMCHKENITILYYVCDNKYVKDGYLGETFCDVDELVKRIKN